MIAFVLHHARVEALGDALDRCCRRGRSRDSGCGKAPAPRRAGPGTERQPSQPQLHRLAQRLDHGIDQDGQRILRWSKPRVGRGDALRRARGKSRCAAAHGPGARPARRRRCRSSVSTMSATRRRTSGARGSATGSAPRRSTGWPMRAILRMAMRLIYGPPAGLVTRRSVRDRHGLRPLVSARPRLGQVNGRTEQPRASSRSRQQRRSGAARAEEEDAARRRLPRDEAPPQLRKAVRDAGPAKRPRPCAATASSCASAWSAKATRADASTTEKAAPAPPRRLWFSWAGAYSSALTISSHIFLASPNSIIVLSRKNSSFSTPA